MSTRANPPTIAAPTLPPAFIVPLLKQQFREPTIIHLERFLNEAVKYPNHEQIIQNLAEKGMFVVDIILNLHVTSVKRINKKERELIWTFCIIIAKRVTITRLVPLRRDVLDNIESDHTMECQ